LIACGSGNNGADGITLARLLHKDYDVDLFLYKKPKNDLAKLQIKRAMSIDVNIIDSFNNNYDVVVDALFGSGLNRAINEDVAELITLLNAIDAYKIACDIPSGVESDGNVSSIAFIADITLTMGALKKSLYLDMAKDYVNDIEVIDLGVSRTLYENETNCFVLDKNDLVLPKRTSKNTHKGDFGHLAVISGEKEGASILCAMAGFHLGAGLVSLVSHKGIVCEPYLMQSHFLPHNTTAIALGMGLGKYESNEIEQILQNNISKVIDADLFYQKDILKVLEKDNVVLTPHPKEFCALLKLCGLGEIDIKTLQKERFKYVELFTQKYPNVVLVLKGANLLIGKGNQLFINPLGDARLSFGGSGDVLAGFIASLLAQNYEPLNAAIQGSLIHTLSSKNNNNDFALTPLDLIEGVKTL
jgi:hydroxyethylthiazole kinase-like uncharacterized protein yjeF